MPAMVTGLVVINCWGGMSRGNDAMLSSEFLGYCGCSIEVSFRGMCSTVGLPQHVVMLGEIVGR